MVYEEAWLLLRLALPLEVWWERPPWGEQWLTPPRAVLPARVIFALLPKSSGLRWRAYPQGRGEAPEGEPSLLPGARTLGLFRVFWLDSGTRQAPRTGALSRRVPCLAPAGPKDEPAGMTWILALSIFSLGPQGVDPL